jgi:hypothetical protein
LAEWIESWVPEINPALGQNIFIYFGIPVTNDICF